MSSQTEIDSTNLSLVTEHLALSLSMTAERSKAAHYLQSSDLDTIDDRILALVRAGRIARMRLMPTHLDTLELFEVLKQGYPVALRLSGRPLETWWIVHAPSQRKIDVVKISDGKTVSDVLTMKELRRVLKSEEQSPDAYQIIAQPLFAEGAFENDPNESVLHNHGDSGHAGHGHGHHGGSGHGADGGAHADHGHHELPWRRLLKLFRPDWRDVLSIILFGLVAGLLSLASPLAVEWMFTTIIFGRYLQPLIIISGMLLVVLLFAGAMRVLQAYVLEMIQRRFFARVVGDLSYRLPNTHRAALNGTNGSELLNRFLDVATIQKATATLLLDVITLVLTTLIGMVLLAFYHPFLLGFDIILLTCMLLITFVLGTSGVKTAINESIVKYRLTHWLQDVVSNPVAFRFPGGEDFSIDRSNQLTIQYLENRKRHFFILMRQMVSSLLLQALASTSLLGIGGWLVLRNQLTPGQLVASELVVTVIVGAFAKIHKSLETFFDLMASTDKVGHILDLPLDVPPRPLRITNANGSLAWSNLVLNDEITHTHIELGSAEIRSGQRVALVSETTDHPSRLLSYLAGLEDAVTGYAEISGIDSRDACRSTLGQIVGYAGQVEIFHGTLMENLTLLCPRVSIENVYWALELVGLKDTLLQLSSGLETELESGGHPLSYDQRNRLMIARAIIGRPRVLMIDRVLDGIPFALASELKQKLCDRSIEWTVLLVSNNPALTEGMDIIRFPKH